MELDIEDRGAVRIVRVAAARIDAAVAIQFKDAMRLRTAAAEGPVLLDLARVGFIDSSGLGAIVAAMKQLPPPARLDLVALQPNVDKVFRLTRMDSIFAIHPDLAAALQSHAA
ncbi:STAS domain-containing protein [Roseivivax sp. CAU 1761]